MTIVKMPSSRMEAWAIKNKHNQLCGMVTALNDGRFKIELMMKWVHHESTKDLAFAWLRGIMTVADA